MGLFPAPYTLSPSSAGLAISTVALEASNSLSNETVVTVAHTLLQFLPTFITVFHAENLTAPVSSMAPTLVFCIASSSAMVAGSSLSSSLGMLRLPPIACTFTIESTTPGSCSARLAQLIAALIMALHVSSIKFSLDSESLVALCNKAFVVGPGQASIPAKMVNKITLY